VIDSFEKELDLQKTAMSFPYQAGRKHAVRVFNQVSIESLVICCLQGSDDSLVAPLQLELQQGYSVMRLLS